MKKGISVFVGLLVALSGVFLFVQGCMISDIRTPEVKANWDEVRGRALLQEAFEAHGCARWDSLETYEVRFHDQFYGFLGKNGNPYPDDKADLILQYIPKTYNGRAQFMEGPLKGKVWGLQSWKTYIESPDGTRTWKPDKDIEFWLPTYQYFIELPARIGKATVVSYAGERLRNGETYDLVFATWGKPGPQKDIDQYLLYINRRTHLIDRLEFTVRDIMKFMKGGLNYATYKDYDGLKIPVYMPVDNPFGKGVLHEMRISDFVPDKVDRSVILPDPHLPFIGDDK